MNTEIYAGEEATETIYMFDGSYEAQPVTATANSVSKTYWASVEIGQDGTYYFSWAEAYSVPEVETLFDESEV